MLLLDTYQRNILRLSLTSNQFIKLNLVNSNTQGKLFLLVISELKCITYNLMGQINLGQITLKSHKLYLLIDFMLEMKKCPIKHLYIVAALIDFLECQ